MEIFHSIEESPQTLYLSAFASARISLLVQENVLPSHSMNQPKTQKLKPRIREQERAMIREAIARYGSRIAAAAALGITTQTLRQKLASR